MATLSPPNLFKMYGLLDPYLSSLRIGGIVGDTRHVAGGGYHISREDLRSHGQGGDYSIQAPADNRGGSDYAAAIDLSLNPQQMVLVSKRLKKAFDEDDDRIDCLREFIGTVDNRNVCGWNRYRTGRRTGWYSSGYSESSHLWHVHLSFFRDYCDDLEWIKAVAEVVAGLPAGTLTGKKVTPGAASAPAPKPKPKPLDEKIDQVRIVEVDGVHAYSKPDTSSKVLAKRPKRFVIKAVRKYKAHGAKHTFVQGSGGAWYVLTSTTPYGTGAEVAMVLTKKSKAYDTHGKARETLKKGAVLKGTVVERFGDGKYLRINSATRWVPLDSLKLVQP